MTASKVQQLFKNEETAYLNAKSLKSIDECKFNLLMLGYEESEILELDSNKAEAVKQIEEYCNDKHIIFRAEPFPKNHLYCKRLLKCEYAEHQDFIDCYLY